MIKRILAVLVAIMLVASPAFSLMGKPNKQVVNTAGVEVKGKEADVAIKATADAVLQEAEKGKIKPATADKLVKTVEKYTDQRAFHPGLGIGGSMSLGGEIGGDLVFSMRKNGWIWLLNVGYSDINGSIKDAEWSQDKVHFGIGTIIEF